MISSCGASRCSAPFPTRRFASRGPNWRHGDGAGRARRRDRPARLAPDAYVVVDDLQWCDDDTLAVIAELALRRPDASRRCGPRWVTRPKWSTTIASQGEVLEVGPIDESRRPSLVRGVAARPRRASDIERCVRAAAGQPDRRCTLLALDRPTGVDPQAAAAVAVAEIDRRRARRTARASRSPARRSRSTPTSATSWCGAGLLTSRGRRALPPAPRPDRVRRDRRGRRRHPPRGSMWSWPATTDDMAAQAMHLAAAGDHAGTVASRDARGRARRHRLGARGGVAARRRAHVTARSRARGAAAAEALSRAGRYREALDLLATTIPPRRPTRSSAPVRTGRSPRSTRRAPRSRPGSPTQTRSRRIDDRAAEPALAHPVPRRLGSGRRDRGRSGRRSRSPAAATASARRARTARSGWRCSWPATLRGNRSWSGRVARRSPNDDVHTAVSVYDTMFFGHLLSGDPQRCAPLAAEMIELTERSSTAWNGYFRAMSLLARINVQGDHRAVLEEARVLARPAAHGEVERSAAHREGLALIDSGHDLDAVEFAERVAARAPATLGAVHRVVGAGRSAVARRARRNGRSR